MPVQHHLSRRTPSNTAKNKSCKGQEKKKKSFVAKYNKFGLLVIIILVDSSHETVPHSTIGSSGIILLAATTIIHGSEKAQGGGCNRVCCCTGRGMAYKSVWKRSFRPSCSMKEYDNNNNTRTHIRAVQSVHAAQP